MNIQVTASHSDFNVRKVFNLHSRSSMLCVAPPNFCILRTKALKHTINDAPIYQRKILPNSSLSSRYQRCPPVCLFGGKGRSENVDDEDSQKSIQKGFGNLKKEQSVEDALRQQIDKQEYYDDGDGGGDSGGRDGGGRGGGRGGYGGSEDGGEFWDELLQVILATAALVFVYLYFISGENWPLLARDYIKVLFGAEKTFRVKQNNEWWANYYQKIAKEWSDARFELPPFLRLSRLALKIAETETWWQKPFLQKLVPELVARLGKPTKIKRRRHKLKKDEDEDEGGPKGVDISTIFLDDSNNEDNYETDTDIEVDDKAKSEDELEPEPEPEPSTRLFGDDFDFDFDFDFDKEFGDVSGSDKEGEEKDSEEEEGEDSDPFESYLIEEDDEKKEEDEEKDFRSYLKKIDMAKAERLASDSSDEEKDELVDKVAGFLQEKYLHLFGPKINGPTIVKRKPRNQKK